jgi:integrase
MCIGEQAPAIGGTGFVISAIWMTARTKRTSCVNLLKLATNRTRLECKTREGFLEYDDYVKIRDSLVEPLKVPFEICYRYGLRKNECLEMEWKDVDIE